MLLSRACLAALLSTALLAAGVAPAAHASHIHRPPTAGHARHKRITHHYVRRRHYYHHRYYRRYSRFRGQQAIRPDRVMQIQQALIRAHYLNGDANGIWDAKTKAAMQKYQADNGWQTRIMPDARALVKLGLGEDYSGAINAKNLTLDNPSQGAAIPAAQEEGFAEASGVSQ